MANERITCGEIDPREIDPGRWPESTGDFKGIADLQILITDHPATVPFVARERADLY